MAMPRYVALLRGINVGRAKQVPMAELRDLLTEAGFAAVRTHLRSGNVIFTYPNSEPGEIAELISARIADQLGVQAKCLVRTGTELAAVVAANPFPDADGSKLLAHFHEPPVDESAAATHDPVALDPDHIRVGTRVIYQWCPTGISNSPDLSSYVTRKWKTAITGRNWNTVSALADLMSG